MDAKHRSFLEVVFVIAIILLAVFVGWKLGNSLNFPWAKKVAFFSRRDGNLEVYLMLADGSQQRRLTFNNVDDGAVTLSLDGKWIACDSARDGNYEVYRMDVHGRGQTRLQ